MNVSTVVHLNRRAVIALLSGVVMFISMSGAWSASNQNPGVQPPQAKPYGMTYPQWAADWMAWAYSIPTAESPFLDPDGRFCQVGQSPPVFLLGNNAGGTTVRTCDVQPGQSILFSPGGVVCVLHMDGETEEELQACAAAILPVFANVSADIDGMPVLGIDRYRAISGLFSWTLPADNIVGAPPGQYEGVIGGWFVMHTPLSAGQHVIHFHDEAGLVFDVTYILNVGRQH